MSHIDTPIDQTDIWKQLERLASEQRDLDLAELFKEDGRAKAWSLSAGDLDFDFSKHLVTEETLSLLLELAELAGVVSKRDAMFAGEPINTTEQRPVLHTALRSSKPVFVDGSDVTEDVAGVLKSMARVADAVRGGSWLGATGKPITSVVNIGIGGSDLGPAMCTEALAHLVPDGLDVVFVSNIDIGDLNRTLESLDAHSTLFIVASKSFTTIETMTNATTARSWLLEELAGLVDDVSEVTKRHMVAVSTNTEAVDAFGIDTENMFGFWDWVGGRYSVDSAIGLSLMCAIGSENFAEFLGGFAKVDDYFVETAPERNAVFVAALLGVWYRNFLGFDTHCVLPYSQALSRFPAYLQQLDMESNGKSVTSAGAFTSYDTAPIIWGEPGTNGQHAFYQMLHQGTTVVPADFIGFFRAEPGPVDNATAGEHQRLLFANMLAQSRALAFGKSAAQVAASGVSADLVPHRSFGGNRPSTTITAVALTPSTLGQLIAFYEHRTFVQGAIWGINSFDQWGVELGKVLATEIFSLLSEPGADSTAGDAGDAGDAGGSGSAVPVDGADVMSQIDSSTRVLIERYRALGP